MLYIAHSCCQWRYLPASFGPWTRVWSQFRRWTRNGTWARALTVLHAVARREDGRTDETPSMVVIDTHLARGASNGGFTFHDRGAPYGRTKGAKRVVAVDVAGLPVAALVVPASTHENRTSELMLEHLTSQGVIDRLELVLVDRGVTAPAARSIGRDHGLEVRRVGWTTSGRSSAPSGTPGASRSPTGVSDGGDAWPSRSRTPPPPRPAGSGSLASPPRSATCHVSEPAGDRSRSPPERILEPHGTPACADTHRVRTSRTRHYGTIRVPNAS
jgi:hypothetical protein